MGMAREVPMVNFIYRHIGRSEALEQLATKKLGHTLTHLPRAPISTKVVFSLSGSKHHVQIDVHTGLGTDLHCQAEDDHMYEALDLLNAKLDHQIQRSRFEVHHEKIRVPFDLDE